MAFLCNGMEIETCQCYGLWKMLIISLAVNSLLSRRLICVGSTQSIYAQRMFTWLKRLSWKNLVVLHCRSSMTGSDVIMVGRGITKGGRSRRGSSRALSSKEELAWLSAPRVSVPSSLYPMKVFNRNLPAWAKSLSLKCQPFLFKYSFLLGAACICIKMLKANDLSLGFFVLTYSVL